MNLNIGFLLLDGYGQFVWPAIFFTFFVCFTLFLKTKKELKKYEALFLLEYKKELVAKVEFPKQRKISKEILSSNINY